jgi:hypothetical protein
LGKLFKLCRKLVLEFVKTVRGKTTLPENTLLPQLKHNIVEKALGFAAT